MNHNQTIFAIHDPGGEQLMLDAGRQGWIVFTEAIGCDPNDRSGKDFSPWTRRGVEPIVRLNNGYEPAGTIPHSSRYWDFAQRVARYVAASRGCSRWIIGNEMNHPVERAGGRNGEQISPEMYVRCYGLCRDAIRALPGHEDDEVLVGAVAPWNNQTTSSTNPIGDWVKYFEDILRLLGPNGCDGITLHTYTHGTMPEIVYSDAKMNAPFANRYYHFLAYRDFMNAVPVEMRHLPAYITETDQDVAWENRNSGWVQAVYEEIDHWNRGAGNQKIHAVALYRWPQGLDLWGIDGKQGVIDDFRAAMTRDYRCQPTLKPMLPTRPVQHAAFAALDEVVCCLVAGRVNVRAAAGYVGVAGGKVIGTMSSGAQATVVAGPVYRDGLRWWQLSRERGVTGWVADTAPDGTRLLMYPQFFSLQLGTPFAGRQTFTQDWGKRPDVYKGIVVGGVALKGHNGLDWGMNTGTPVLATADGVVIQSAYDAHGFGNYVLLEHPWGQSLYAHMVKPGLAVGRRVRQGDQVGLSGDTGFSSGPHLHFSIRIYPTRRNDGWGGYCNPRPFLPAELWR